MAVAPAVETFLRSRDIPYELLIHPRSVSSTYTAQHAHVPGIQLAKSVLLEDESGYLVAVLPSTHKLDLGKLRNQLDRMLTLAVEREVSALFSDCDPGAIPAPIFNPGEAYEVETVVDDTLLQQAEIYFEGGDHETLVHVHGRDFRALMAALPHGCFAYPA